MSHLSPGDSQYVFVNGARLHYQVLGRDAGRLPLIFTHGGGPGSTAWSNFRLSVSTFADDRLCYFVDLPQFGVLLGRGSNLRLQDQNGPE